MTAPLMLGIDLGTSATKMGLVSPDGQVVAVHAEPNAVQSPHPDWREMRCEEWWAGLCRGIPRLCLKAQVRPAQIVGVGFSVLYPALIPLDAAGNALRPAILYSDQRSVRQLAWIQEKMGNDRIFRTCGNVPVVGTCSLTSLLWLKENEPEVFQKARFFAHANTYLAARLTGQFGMDWSNATLSGLFDVASYSWSEMLADLAGIPMEKLPPLIAPCELLGRVAREAADATGLRPGTPVCLGAGDTACSALGAGLVEKGQICLTCGTTDNIALCVDAPRSDTRFVASAHALRDRWLLIGTMSNTGAALEWCARLLGLVADDGTVSYEKIHHAAATVPPGAQNLVFLPYLQGERSPIWDPFARGVFVGLSLHTRGPHLIRAVMEGCAFAIRQNITIAEEILGTSVKEIKIMGGGARSPLWNQIRADILQRALRRVSLPDTSLLGAAMLAAVAAGQHPSAFEAARAMQAPTARELITPDPGRRESYDRLYKVYLGLYPALSPLFASLRG